MTNTFQGFQSDDFGYTPEFELSSDSRTLEERIAAMNPDPLAVKEHEELFGAEGLYMRMIYADAAAAKTQHCVFTQHTSTKPRPSVTEQERLMALARMHVLGTELPSLKELKARLNELYPPPPRTLQINWKFEF